jgi:prephenate dehydrogenase
MKSVAIAGLGLVGGSIARGLTAAGWRVVGVDRPRPLRAALRAGAIARGLSSLAKAASGVDVVGLAAPPRANLALLRALSRLSPPPRVVTDVGSVKGPICAAARALRLAWFVGGHPMAGRERGGFAASTGTLFAGRTWVVTPGARPAVRAVRALARALGARVVTMEPAVHDRTVAFLSHLPQLLSWALLAAAVGDPVASRHLRVAGPGFADMTRLARSPRGLWRDILGENAVEVARALRVFRGLLPRPPSRA